MKPRPDKQLILDSLAAHAKSVGRAPSRSEFFFLSGFGEHHVLRFFPSWTAALQAAGLQPPTANLRLDDRLLLEDWGRVIRQYGKVPPRRIYRHLGKFDRRTIERRFARWSQLPKAFRQFAHNKPEWADVLALLPPPPTTPSPEPPSDSASAAPPSLAHDAAGAQARREHPQALPPVPSSRSSRNADPLHPQPSASSKFRYPCLDGRPTYGQPMDFRGLRHEPVNEQGVLLLFGMVAKELGYIVESVQSGFPDCEAKRQIAPHRWQRVHLEFEFESRNFRDHGHSTTGCDVIVCWRHNWPDHPYHLEILELSSLLPTIADLPAK